MFIKTKDYYQSSLLAQVTGLFHGYSTESTGDMRKESNREAWLKTLAIDPASLVLGEQIHGSVVVVVDNAVRRQIAGVDGLVTKQHGLTLGVMVADCVPLLFFDTKKRIVAAVHAGWRGTLDNIAGVCVKKMVEEGSTTRDILVSVGPHIGMCCYSVPQERAEKFQAIYGTDPQAASQQADGWHLDIGYVNVLQLKAAGISSEHIDAPPTCTSCQADTFFSYRRDTKEGFGEMLAAIAVQ